MKKRIYIYELYKTQEGPQPFCNEYYHIKKLDKNPKEGFESMGWAIKFIQEHLKQSSYLDKCQYTILEVYEKE